MDRLQLFEFEDQAWCPTIVRNLITDFIKFQYKFFGTGHLVANHFARFLETTNSSKVVELCAGSAPLTEELHGAFESAGLNVTHTLTDLYPNIAAFELAAKLSPANIVSYNGSVDAAAVPEGLIGVRFFLASFHHFDKTLAKSIFEDTINRGQPIAIYEICERRPSDVLGSLFFVPIMTTLSAPFIGRFDIKRFLLTYVLPLFPLIATWDAVVSCFRNYNSDELANLLRGIEGFDSYDWAHGYLSSPLEIYGRRLTLTRINYFAGAARTIESS